MKGVIEMNMRSGLSAALAATFIFAFGSAGTAAAAPPADWSKIPANTVNMFYPGQSTYEWLVSTEHKKGNKKVPQGVKCSKCHEDDEEDMGDAIVGGDHPLEPTPIAGKQGFIELAVRAAHDSDNLYLQFQWESKSDGPARVAMMLDDGKVPNFASQGCWLTCHDGMKGTQGAADAAKVKAHPLLGDAGLKKKDVRKYLAASRADGTSWDKTKSAADIAAVKKSGSFIDLMYWRMKDGKPQTKDSYVLEYRLDDAKDSIADAGESSGVLKDGVYTVVIQRKLNTGHAGDDKVLKVGGVYSVGFAVHDGKKQDRFHHTSFPLQLGIGADGDIKAVTIP